MADLEMQMNAVERVKYYTHVDNESYEGKITHNRLHELLTLYCQASAQKHFNHHV